MLLYKLLHNCRFVLNWCLTVCWECIFKKMFYFLKEVYSSCFNFEVWWIDFFKWQHKLSVVIKFSRNIKAACLLVTLGHSARFRDRVQRGSSFLSRVAKVGNEQFSFPCTLPPNLVSSAHAQKWCITFLVPKALTASLTQTKTRDISDAFLSARCSFLSCPNL